MTIVHSGDGGSVAAAPASGLHSAPMVRLLVESPGGIVLTLSAMEAEALVDMIADAAGLDVGVFLTVGEVAAMCQIGEATVRSLKSRGKLPPPDRLRGKRPEWRLSTVRRWAAVRWPDDPDRCNVSVDR